MAGRIKIIERDRAQATGVVRNAIEDMALLVDAAGLENNRRLRDLANTLRRTPLPRQAQADLADELDRIAAESEALHWQLIARAQAMGARLRIED